MFSRIDPLIRLLIVCVVLATVLPVRGMAREAAQMVSNAAVFTLFLLYGLRLSRGEVVSGLRNVRLLLPLTLWCFGAMALFGWGLWRLSLPLFDSGLDAGLALGFLYLGCLPSTVQSATAYSSLAGGDVASSVVAAAWLNVLGVIITAPLFALLSGGQAGGLQGAALGKIGLLLLLPFIAGQLLQNVSRGWIADHKQTIAVMDRTTIGIAVYVAFSGAVAEGIWSRIDAQSWAVLVIACALLLALGYGGAWVVSGLVGLVRPQRISMLFAGAQKSVAMGAPLATVLFPAKLAGLIILPLILYHLAQLVVAASLLGVFSSQVED